MTLGRLAAVIVLLGLWKVSGRHCLELALPAFLRIPFTPVVAVWAVMILKVKALSRLVVDVPTDGSMKDATAE